MLEEAVEYLEQKHGSSKTQQHGANGTAARRRVGNGQAKGWEILIVSDGSVDSTAETALEFAKEHNIQPGSIRVVQLEENRGKGGAVTHGMRHVRGQYVIFADADGATKFADVETMVQRAEELQTTDGESRAVIVGSRAHLVGSEAVVKVSTVPYSVEAANGDTAIDASEHAHVLVSRLHSASNYAQNISHC